MYPAIPAATLVLLRDRPGQPPELPMIGRGAHLKFAASRMVFPGGRVDDDDRLVAARADLLTTMPAIDAEELAHRIAAVRETIEEIGLAPAIAGITGSMQLQEIRTAMHGGTPLSALLQQLGLRIDPEAIHPFARWRPDHELSRRFDTRFYIARVPDIGEAVADGVESSHCIWGSARDHLAAGGLIFPTICNLEWIAEAGDFESAVARSHRFPIKVITPQMEERDGEQWICIPEGLGYPVTAQRTAGMDRGSAPSKPSITRAPG